MKLWSSTVTIVIIRSVRNFYDISTRTGVQIPESSSYCPSMQNSKNLNCIRIFKVSYFYIISNFIRSVVMCSSKWTIQVLLSADGVTSTPVKAADSGIEGLRSMVLITKAVMKESFLKNIASNGHRGSPLGLPIRTDDHISKHKIYSLCGSSGSKANEEVST